MSSANTSAANAPQPHNVDVVVVGAGFAGMYMLHKLRQIGLSALVFERGTGVGGTWYWNRYPGARVDVESREYSYSFSEDLERDWRWTERYATQPELLRYANFVADRFDLRRDIRFETIVTRMTYDEVANLWTVETDKGDVLRARFCVMATGCLSVAKQIDIEGVEKFEGPIYRTSDWPKEGVDFAGQTVGLIGTGSSAIQSIPEIASNAMHLTVFQRTPNFTFPAQNAPLDQALVDDWLQNRSEYRHRQRSSPLGGHLLQLGSSSALDVSPAERDAAYEQAWAEGGIKIVAAFSDLLTNRAANDTAAEFVRRKIQCIVTDPRTANILQPTDYPIATKRPCIDTNYYATFNRPNVDLVDLRATPIEAITRSGVAFGGEERAFDSIVLAIGFDAMTGALCAIDICGRNGIQLKDQWSNGPKTYLGLAVAGFPNLFIVTGPGSPSVLANMVVAIEQHVEWIAECLSSMRSAEVDVIEAKAEAQSEWVQQVNDVADMTLYPLANSWYTGANIPGKARVFMPYVGSWCDYVQKCADVAKLGYSGFSMTANSIFVE